MTFNPVIPLLVSSSHSSSCYVFFFLLPLLTWSAYTLVRLYFKRLSSLAHYSTMTDGRTRRDEKCSSWVLPFFLKKKGGPEEGRRKQQILYAQKKKKTKEAEARRKADQSSVIILDHQQTLISHFFSLPVPFTKETTNVNLDFVNL